MKMEGNLNNRLMERSRSEPVIGEGATIRDNAMNRYAITFGQGHPLKNHYCVIQAPNSELAREAAFKVFGAKWAFFYEDMKEQEDRFGMRPLDRMIVVDEYGSVGCEPFLSEIKAGG